MNFRLGVLKFDRIRFERYQTDFRGSYWRLNFIDFMVFINFIFIHSNLDLMRVSGMAYIKSRISLDLSECKQPLTAALLNCSLTAAGKRITRCVFDE